MSLSKHFISLNPPPTKFAVALHFPEEEEEKADSANVAFAIGFYATEKQPLFIAQIREIERLVVLANCQQGGL